MAEKQPSRSRPASLTRSGKAASIFQRTPRTGKNTPPERETGKTGTAKAGPGRTPFVVFAGDRQAAGFAGPGASPEPAATPGLPAGPDSKVEIKRRLHLNNPGGIRKSRKRWLGLTPDQPDPELVKFASPAYGLRAFAVALMELQSQGGLPSVASLLGRRIDRDGEILAKNVQVLAKKARVGPDQPIDLQNPSTLKSVMTGLIRLEFGRRSYSPTEIRYGLLLSGVEVPEEGGFWRALSILGGTVLVLSISGLFALEAVNLIPAALEGGLGQALRELSADTLPAFRIGFALTGLLGLIAYFAARKS